MSTNHAIAEPSSWVRRFAPAVPAGEVLDLACGNGRHAAYFAALGHPVVGVDKDQQALASIDSSGVQKLAMDLENGAAWPFESNRFSGIVITNYLHHPLFPRIFASLNSPGVLIVETFAQGNAQFGKPSNPAFLLRPGELLEIVRAESSHPLHVLAYENGYVELPKPAMIQRICVIKGEIDLSASRFALN